VDYDAPSNKETAQVEGQLGFAVGGGGWGWGHGWH
jgi:hypothetical protein